jgi:hypothetical protein
VNLLVVYSWPPDQEMRLGVERHLRALERSDAEITYANAAAAPPSREARRARYDGIVLHTTFLCSRWSVDFPRVRRRWQWLSAQECPIVALPQDEYSYSEVLDEWLEELGSDAVFSCFDETTREPIYRRTRGSFRLGLTGYLDPETATYCERHALPGDERPYDVVYRAKRLPFWLGRHGQLKHEIGTATAEHAQRLELRTDISTRAEDTIFGTGWLDFLMSGRAVVGCESGSSVLDRRGEIRRRSRELLALDPTMPFEEFDRHMPAGWDSWAFFAVSPRHFEAVLTRTCQILVEGDYGGILEPNRHYLPVRRDLADLDAVLERLHDRQLVQDITACAYEEVYADGRWKTDDFSGELLDSLAIRHVTRPRRPLGTLAAPVLPPPHKLHARIRQAAVALHALTVRPRLAALVGKSLLASPSDAAVVPAVMRDLLLLGALDRFEQYQSTRGGKWSIRPTRVGNELRLTSQRGDEDSVRPAGEHVSAITWDNSQYGTFVPLSPDAARPVNVRVGSDGRWRFDGLSRLAARHPEFPWARALRIPALGAGPVRSETTGARRVRISADGSGNSSSPRRSQRGHTHGPSLRNPDHDNEAEQ